MGLSEPLPRLGEIAKERASAAGETLKRQEARISAPLDLKSVELPGAGSQLEIVGHADCGVSDLHPLELPDQCKGQLSADLILRVKPRHRASLALARRNARHGTRCYAAAALSCAHRGCCSSCQAGRPALSRC